MKNTFQGRDITRGTTLIASKKMPLLMVLTNLSPYRGQSASITTWFIDAVQE